MKAYFGAAWALLHIGTCFTAISPSLISVDQEILENILGESDGREVDGIENNSLCHKQDDMGSIDPDVSEDTKLRVVRKINCTLDPMTDCSR